MRSAFWNVSAMSCSCLKRSVLRRVVPTCAAKRRGEQAILLAEAPGPTGDEHQGKLAGPPATVDGRHEQVTGDVGDATGERPVTLRRRDHGGERRLQSRRVQSAGIGAVLGDDARTATIALDDGAARYAQQPGAVGRHVVEDLLWVGAVDAAR